MSAQTMRSSRTANGEHDSSTSSSGRRGEYHHHSSSSTSTSAAASKTVSSEMNGHSTDHRSKRLAGSSGSAASSSSSLIKRMKVSSSNETKTSSTSSTTNNNKDSHSSHRNTSTSTTSTNNATMLDECNQLSMAGFFEEESAAINHDSIANNAMLDFAKFSRSAQNFRKLVKAILEAKNTKGASLEGVDKPFIDYKIQGLLELAEMKNLNRLDKFRLRESRNQLLEAKERVDKIHMKWQNVQYEIMHLQKEEKTCASFRSKDENLELVEEGKFLRSDDVPEDLRHLVVLSDEKQQAALIRPEATTEELHQLRLAQLDWELKQRLAYENNLKESQVSSERLSLEITSKRKVLARFDPTLKAIVEASKPLVAELNVPLHVHNSYHNMTPHLPEPLYVLYVQLFAYKNASGSNYDVNIVGSLEEAQEFKEKLRQELSKRQHGQLRKEEDDEEGGEDDEEKQRRKVRGKKSRFNSVSQQQQHETSKDSNNESGGLQDVSNISMDVDVDDNNKYEKVLLADPIKVNVVFPCQNYKLSCLFTYFHNLEMVGVNYQLETVSFSTGSSSPFSVINFESNLLSKLLDAGDTGLAPPNPAAVHVLRLAGIESYQQLFVHLGYTYEWAQSIAGLEFLDAQHRPQPLNEGRIRAKSALAIESIGETIKAIYRRLEARIDLQEQLNVLFITKQIDVNMFENLTGILPAISPSSQLTQFDRIGLEQFLAEMDRQPRRKEELIKFFSSEAADGTQPLADIFDENNFFFKLEAETIFAVKESEVVQSRHYTLGALIIIPHNYPARWPFLLLTLADTHAEDTLPAHYLEPKWLRALEEHINVHLPLNVVPTKWLLMRQIFDIQCGLDVLIDTRRRLMLKENPAMQVVSGPHAVNHNLLSLANQRL